eukprot:11649785-Alexandrium_andersonii.AAC.1
MNCDFKPPGHADKNDGTRHNSSRGGSALLDHPEKCFRRAPLALFVARFEHMREQKAAGYTWRRLRKPTL